MKRDIQLTRGKKIQITWWQLALMAVAVSGISRLIATKSAKKSRGFYTHKMKQAPWAPPGWVFGPAWIINNFFVLMALVRILNMKGGKLKNKLLVLQLLIWIIFYSFDYVYFKKKSPILAGCWTKADFTLAMISIAKTWNTDRALAGSYLPLAAWTFYAGTVADYQLIHNPDPVFKTKALLDYL